MPNSYTLNTVLHRLAERYPDLHGLPRRLALHEGVPPADKKDSKDGDAAQMLATVKGW